MYHSLIISGKNTYDTWHMVPSSRPLVNPPPVKTNFVEVPGTDISLDYTELLLGRPAYGQRTGSWEFLLRPGSKWALVYDSLVSYIHGVAHHVILEDDPDYYYQGRLSVDQWQSQEKWSTITINYTLNPNKYLVSTGQPVGIAAPNAQIMSYFDIDTLIGNRY